MPVQKMTAYSPLPPAPETLSDPRFTITDESRRRLVLYCPRNHVGAVYHREAEMWSCYVPIDLPSFLGSLADLGIKLPDGPDLQAWLETISQGAIARDRGPAN